MSGGVITTVAGNGTRGFSGDNGPATSAQLDRPYGIAVDAAGSLYIADNGDSRIRKVTGGVITTVAGNGVEGYYGDDGPAIMAQLSNPQGLAVDAAGNLYIADTYAHRVRKISAGVMVTVAGNGTYGFSCDNGPATSARLDQPVGVTVDSAGNLYIADSLNQRIRKVSTGAIATVAGNGSEAYGGDNGPATGAQLNAPMGVAVDTSGSVYIADTLNNRIRKVSHGVITAVAGDGTEGYSGDNGPATSAQLDQPVSVAVDTSGNVFFADYFNNRVRKISGGVITTVAGNGTSGFSGDSALATSAQLNFPLGVAVDPAGNLYISDSHNGRVRKVSDGLITTVAGTGSFCCNNGDNGPATSATLRGAAGLSADGAGNLYIADSINGRVRKVTNGVITTVAGGGSSGLGDSGPASGAWLDEPWGVAIDAAGNIYVADIAIGRIRILTPGTPPAITAGGIVPNDSTVSAIQSGSWISIFGSDLAGSTALWNGDFPQTLAGTSVTIDNKSAYLWYVSPQQINLQVPDDPTTGTVEVAVNTASGTAYSTVTLATYAPSFSLLGDGKLVAGEILTPDGSGAYGGGTYDLVGPSNTFSYSTRPVKAGETLVLYGVGFGPTTPVVAPGQPFSGAARTNSPVTVTIGGVSAAVSFAGITEAGLYQLNITVPPNTGSGDQALQASVNGIQTAPGPVVTVQ